MVKKMFKVEVTEYSNFEEDKIYIRYKRYIQDEKTIDKVYALIGVENHE